MDLGRLSSYRIGGRASASMAMRERSTEFRRRMEFRAAGASRAITDFPMRLREPTVLLRTGAGIAALILLAVIYTSSSSPARQDAATIFQVPQGAITSPTAPPTAAAGASTSMHSAAGGIVRDRTSTARAKAGAVGSHTTHPRSTSTPPATPIKPAATTSPVKPDSTTTTPAQTTTTVQTVTVTTPAPTTSTPTRTTTTTAPAPSTPAPGTMTESTFKALQVNQITRGVIASVFGQPATAKQLTRALGSQWLDAAVKALPATTSCIYYFNRGAKAQTFQLCFDPSHMLVLKQALRDSTATGSG